MRIPKADQAIISQDKLCAYLLNPAHRRGGSRAKLLHSMGYSASEWQLLEAVLRSQHLTTDVVSESDSDYGKRYEIVAHLPDRRGGAVLFRSIWQIDTGSDCPRLITIHPE